MLHDGDTTCAAKRRQSIALRSFQTKGTIVSLLLLKDSVMWNNEMDW